MGGKVNTYRLDSHRIDGAGGEYGTAGAGDVRSTKTLGTDNGVIPGTLAERTTTNITPSSSAQNFLAGIYPDFTVAATPQFYLAATPTIADGSYYDVDVGLGKTFAACQSNSGSPFAVTSPNFTAGAANVTISLYSSGGTMYARITNNTGANATFKVSAK